MAKKVIQPGEYGLSEAALVLNDGSAKDLTPILESFSFTESIDSVFCTGVINIVDAADNLGQVPILGDERVVISFQTPDYSGFEPEEREHSFRITSITSVNVGADGNGQTAQFGLMDELAYEQYFQSVKSTYTDSISDQAQIIFDETVKNVKFKTILKYKINIDETEGVVHDIITGDTPFDAYNHLLGWAYSSNYPSSNFRLFQNKDGYNFRNLEQIIEDEMETRTTKKFIKTRHYKLDPAQAVAGIAADKAYTIMQFSQKQRSSFFKAADDGAFNNQVALLDFTTKRVVKTTKKYDHDAYKNLRDTVAVSDEWAEKFTEEPNTTNWIYTDGLKLHRPNLVEAMHNKLFFRHLFQNNTVQLRIPGNSDLTAGQLIKVLVPETSTKKENRVNDKSMSGHFIIKDITHSFSFRTFYQSIVAVRVGDTELKNEA
jgi:hypothetical protein